jgi:hypothetical protein
MLGLGYVGLGIADPFPSASAPSNAPTSPPFDQPNPRGPIYPIELRTFLQSTKLNLIGKDVIFGTPKAYDYPNPRGYIYPSDLRNFTQSTPLNIIGTDKFFGLGGPRYDYPNPRSPQRAIDLINLTSSGLALKLTVAPPNLGVFAQYDYPNPRGPQRSIDALTIAGSLPIPIFTIPGVPCLVYCVEQSAVAVYASDSPSGQGWKGAGYMSKYEIDTSIQINGDFLNAIDDIYVDPSGVTLFILDPSGAQTIAQYPGAVIRDAQGHYHYTIAPSKSGTWTYKWQAGGSFIGTSPDTTFTVNASALIAG